MFREQKQTSGTSSQPIELNESEDEQQFEQAHNRQFLWRAESDHQDVLGEVIDVLHDYSQQDSNHNQSQSSQCENQAIQEGRIYFQSSQNEYVAQNLQVPFQIQFLEETEEKQLFIAFPKKKFEQISQQKISPWLTQETKQIQDPLMRLHNQIIDYCNYIKPSQQSHSRKSSSYYALQSMLEEQLPGITLKVFGSFATKLYLPDGDIDIVVMTNDCYQTSHTYQLIYEKLKLSSEKYTHLQYIRSSKVPIIKFQEISTGFQFDICVDKPEGIKQLYYVSKIDKRYPQFRYYVYIMKYFLKSRGFSQTYTGGIGSFLLFCMILAFLQEMHRSEKHYNLGEGLIKFLQFYGEQDWSTRIINVQNGTIDSRERDSVYFSCISPQDKGHDIGKAAYKIIDILKVFRNRSKRILATNFMKGQSILKVLLNPSNKSFPY